MITEEKANRIDKRAWLLGLMFMILCIPMLWEYFESLHIKPYYRFSPVFILVIISIFIARWRKSPVSQSAISFWPWLLLLISGLLVILAAFLYYIPWLVAFSAFIFLGVLVSHLSRKKEVEGIWAMWIALLLVLRPPYQLMVRVMIWMENASSSTASLVLDYLSVQHSVQGNSLALPKHYFEIDKICSGWVSIVSVLAFACIICLLKRRRIIHCIVFFFLSIVASWMLNILSILALVGLMIWQGVDWTQGYLYYYFQLSLLLVSVILVNSADNFSEFILSSIESDEQKIRRSKNRTAWLSYVWQILVSFKVASIFSFLKVPNNKEKRSSTLSFGLLCIALVSLISLEVVVIYYRPVQLDSYMHSEENLSQFNPEEIYFTRKGWEKVNIKYHRRGYENIWGALSITWELRYNDTIVMMSLDYPFDTWHDVKRCYTKIGWKAFSEKILKGESPMYGWGASETQMTLPNGNIGYILCSHCDHEGNTVEPKPVDHDFKMLRYRLHPKRWTAPFGQSRDKNKSTFYQTQAMSATSVQLEASVKEEIKIMYAIFREQIKRAVYKNNLKSKDK